MKAKIPFITFFVLLLTVFCYVTSVSAEVDSGSVEWQNDETSWYTPGDPRGIDTVKKMYETVYTDSSLSCFFRFLQKNFESSGVDWSTNQTTRQKFNMELDTLIQEAVVFDSRVNDKKCNLITLDSLVDSLLKSLKTIRFSKGSKEGMIIFFPGKSTAIPLRVCTDGNTSECLTAQQAIDIRLRAKTIDEFFNIYKESLRKKLYERILTSSKAWKNYLYGSPFLFPWELFVNGLTSRTSDLWTPPGHKLLLLHPSLGILLTGLKSKSIDSMTVNQILSVECGWIKYIDDMRSNSIGAGILASIGGQSPLRCGIALHWNSTMIGAVLPVKQIDNFDKIAIVGSVDIIGFANWARDRADQLFMNKFQEIVKK
jgi:hypothetical protein